MRWYSDRDEGLHLQLQMVPTRMLSEAPQRICSLGRTVWAPGAISGAIILHYIFFKFRAICTLKFYFHAGH